MKTKTKNKLKYCDVLVDAKAVSQKRFTYSYTPDFKIRPGFLVKVPFRGRKISGIVLGINKKKPEFRTKKISEILFAQPVLDSPHLRLSKIMAKYYFTTLSSFVFVMVPRYLRKIKTSKPVKKYTNQVKICPILKKSKEKKVNLKKFLLFDPEESQTLKIYTKSIEKNLHLGKKTLFLVPDTKLWLVKEIKKKFGKEVAIFNPEMSKLEHFKLWLKIKRNHFNVIIGSHLALFSHLSHIGLIIVHHEDDDFYKNEQRPRYHLCKVAEEFAKITNATLLFQSFAPRIETYYKFKKDKKAKIIEIKSYFSGSKNQIIDLRKERTLISFVLEQKIARALSKKGKVLIFHNRKGFARFFICRDCGETNYLKAEERPLALCPHCRSTNIKNASFGTARIEMEIKKIFPKAQVIRVEKNNTKHQMLNTKFDIVIGTSYLLKQNLPKFDLGAVILAELGLNLPDFRSSERVFRNLFKVASLSKNAYFQTFSPYNKTIRLAAKKNFKEFYNKELSAREKESFPPFRQMVRLILEDENQKKAYRQTSYLAGELKSLSANFPKRIDVFGPAQALKRKGDKKYRYTLLLLGENLYPALSLVPNNFKVDVDPVDLL